MTYTILKIGATALMLMALVILGMQIVRTALKTTQAQTAPPAFKAQSCFVAVGDREAWSKPADGIVIRVGIKKYLVLYESEAQRSFGGDKPGWEETIATFDQTHVHTVCPDAWVQHTSQDRGLTPHTSQDRR